MMRMEKCSYLAHHGIKGMRWGVRRYQNEDGSLTPEGRAHYLGERKNQTVFVSGSSKTQDKESGYYLKKLPYSVRYELKEHMKRGDKIIVGDAPGIDRQTQDYLAKKKYTNVEVFSPGKEGARYLANPGWKQTNVDKPGAEIGSKEWLAAKDFVMSNLADKGIAVTIDEGAKATRKNVDRLVEANKEVMVYEIGRDRGRLGNLLGLRGNKATTFINGKEVSEDYYDGYWVSDPDNTKGNVPEHEYGTRTREIAAKKIAAEDKIKTGSRSWVEEAANDPEHWELIDDTPGERLYARRDPPKSSGRYKAGSKEKSKVSVDSMNAVTDALITGNKESAYRKLHNDGYRPSEIAKMLGESTKDDGKPSGETRAWAAKYKVNKNDISSLKARQNRARSLQSSGKTIAEIADIMGAPVSSIKDYLYEDFDSLR